MTTPLGTQTYQTYLDLEEEVKPWLQKAPTDTSGDANLQLLTDMACVQIQNYIGQPIAATRYGPDDGIGKFDGSGGLYSGYIMLPKCPVISVESVIEWQGSNPVTLEQIDPATGGDGYQINYLTGRLTRVLGGVWNRPFIPGSNSVWVTWTAGYNPIPADIRVATLELVKHWWTNTQQQAGGNRGGGNGEYDAMVQAGLWAGVPDRLIALLSPYVRIGIR